VGVNHEGGSLAVAVVDIGDRELRKPYSFLLRDYAKKAKYAKTYISFFRIYFFFSHFSDSI